MKPEDQLMDALLKEQAKKRDADEQLLDDIEKAIDADGNQSGSRFPVWIPLSAAAAIAMGGAWWYDTKGRDEAPELAYHKVESPVISHSSSSEGSAAAPLIEGEAQFGTERIETKGLIETPADPAAPGAALATLDAVEELTLDEIQPAEAAAESLRPEREGTASPMDAEAQAPKAAAEPEFDDSMVDGRVAPMTPAPKPSLRKSAPEGSLSSRGMSRNSSPKKPSASNDKMRLDGEVFGRRPSVITPPDTQDGGGGGGGFSRDRYDQLVDQPWKSTWEAPLSTFSIDVDTASYTNLRRAIREGRTVQPDSVRIEECINYFDYRYPAPGGDRPFAVDTAVASCPWAPQHLLARVAIKGREVEKNARPASNLTFLIDVSGSMQSADKLQLLKRSMKTLVKQLDERDRVGIVVYAGTEGVALPPTLLDDDGKERALSAISKLESGGSTNGGAGIKRAYQMALNHKRDGGVNRVILATDGDFNVGVTGQGELVDMVKTRAAKGVYLTVLGFGTGNLNDALMEKVSNDGNGNYFYIDGNKEANRVLLNKLSGTLVTIAKDVKIQIEFNPGKVKAYRLIGYANRILRDRDFNDDKIDAGEIGAGHTVTAFYEIVPDGVDLPNTGQVDKLRYQRKPSAEPDPESEVELVESDDWFTLKLRYKHPDGEKSKLIEKPVRGEAVKVTDADKDFQMAAAVAMFGMKLRNFDEIADFSWDQIAEIARPALAEDPTEQRSDFVKMLKSME